ncbi:MAG: LOW QUALITY PROTEIN: hypothetical protein BJ554DRAFT_7574 [Olpidium bornovanus]|uniref:Helicase ATP-binding domain-containing protein n=1 Tax=Olpidium bornovanus TaxID=278681 RepID=A0A8H8DJC3_9FUNG|nr:MAG: LOW QUALITY PROTEIN: hypothetical protein BJ554DRAFT_7574 [Olpidium bornovanus]
MTRFRPAFVVNLCSVVVYFTQAAYVFRLEICSVIYGGGSPAEQRQIILKGCDILIATPGRLKDFLERGTVSVKKVKTLILDEADRMLDMGFEPDIRADCVLTRISLWLSFQRTGPLLYVLSLMRYAGCRGTSNTIIQCDAQGRGQKTCAGFPQRGFPFYRRRAVSAVHAANGPHRFSQSAHQCSSVGAAEENVEQRVRIYDASLSELMNHADQHLTGHFFWIGGMGQRLPKA